jgi:hypothetical protein
LSRVNLAQPGDRLQVVDEREFVAVSPNYMASAAL